MTMERKQEIINTYKRDEKDTGSPEVQIALLTERITELTEHLKVHPKDNHSITYQVFLSFCGSFPLVVKTYITEWAGIHHCYNFSLTFINYNSHRLRMVDFSLHVDYNIFRTV